MTPWLPNDEQLDRILSDWVLELRAVLNDDDIGPAGRLRLHLLSLNIENLAVARSSARVP